jgi:hypothetical protein
MQPLLRRIYGGIFEKNYHFTPRLHFSTYFYYHKVKEDWKSLQHGVWNIQCSGLNVGEIKAGSASRINA